MSNNERREGENYLSKLALFGFILACKNIRKSTKRRDNIISHICTGS